jgi:hypothetical protein
VFTSKMLIDTHNVALSSKGIINSPKIKILACLFWGRFYKEIYS